MCAPERGPVIVSRMSEVLAENTVDIASLIVAVRKQRVLLDETLATLYGVSTKALNQAVRRNRERFPADFSFALEREEWASLRSRIASLEPHLGKYRKYTPTVFTEHGAIMAATVLNSPRAVEMSVYVVRAFVQLRELLASNTALARKLNELEGKLKNHDQAIAAILSAIRELMNPPPPKRRPIGFTADLTEKS